MAIKTRLGDLWETHKWLILAAAAVIWLVVSSLAASLTQKTCVLRILLLDSQGSLSQQDMESQVMAALGLDENKYCVEVQADLLYEQTQSGGYAMTSLSRFLADVGSEKLDVCGMLEPTFCKYAQSDAFLDLRGCFTPEELEPLDGALYITEDGRVVGIYTDRLPGIQAQGFYPQGSGRGIIGIIYNTTHLEQAKQYLLWLAGS